MITKTTNLASPLFIRIAVGCIFLSEGVQKFVFPSALGAGRFEKIGIPAADFFAPFVGSFEIVCGLFILIGFYTRLAVVPLIIIMCIAIGTTKIPELIEKGFWVAAHNARTDFSMLMSNIFLLITGSGKLSIDFTRQKFA